MLSKFWKNPLYRFLGIAVFLFLLWEILYIGIIHPQGNLDRWIIAHIIHHAHSIIDLIGFAVVPEKPYDENFRTLGIDGGHSVWIGDPCNGLVLFALFSGFLLAYPGALKHKIWFIPLGIISIHFVNVLRVVGLAFLAKYYPDSLEFNHNYTFTIVVYSFVFGLWMLWVRYFGLSFKVANHEK